MDLNKHTVKTSNNNNFRCHTRSSNSIITSIRNKKFSFLMKKK